MISPAYESFINEICYDYHDANEGFTTELLGLLKSFVLKFVIAPFIIIGGLTALCMACIIADHIKYNEAHKEDFKDAKAYGDYITKLYQDAANDVLKDSKVKESINNSVKKLIAKQMKENKDLAVKYNLTVKDFSLEIKKCPVTIKMPDFPKRGDRMGCIGGNVIQAKDACLACVTSLKKESIAKFDEDDAYFAERFTGIIFYDPIKKEIIQNYGYDEKLPENVIDRKEYNRYINSIKK